MPCNGETPAGVQLVRYEAARRTLAEAVRFDEIKQIMDVAIAAQLSAKQAKDPELINHVTDIRRRAAREAGKKLAEMEKAKGGEQYQCRAEHWFHGETSAHDS